MLKTGCITYSAPLHIASITRARTQTENIIIMKVLCIDDTQLANSAVYREEDLYLSRVYRVSRHGSIWFAAEPSMSISDVMFFL